MDIDVHVLVNYNHSVYQDSQPMANKIVHNETLKMTAEVNLSKVGICTCMV